MTGGHLPEQTVRPADVDLTAGFVPFGFSQGPRPLCLAFATSSAHRLVRDGEGLFSPEALWHTCFLNGQTGDGGTTIEAIGLAIHDNGQPSLNAWPYNSMLGSGTEHIPGAAQNVAWYTASLTYIPLLPAGQPYIEDALTGAKPVLVAIEVSDEFSFVVAGAVVALPATIPEPQGRHAVLIVGASWDEEVGRIYRVLNSWGPDWADGGYTWLPALYIDRYAAVAAILA